MITITLIEEIPIFRQALKTLINSYAGCTVINDFKESSEIQLQEEKRTDLVIISISNFKTKYTEEIEKIRSSFPFSKFIILSDEINYETFSSMVKADIYAFSSRKSSPIEFENLILNSNKFEISTELKVDSIGREQLRKNRREIKIDDILLTKREIEVLNLVCQEQTNSEISVTLGLSIRTIETFRRNMINKNNCKSIIGVLLKAIKLRHIKLSS